MKFTILDKATHKFKTPFAVLAEISKAVKAKSNRNAQYVLIDFKYTPDKGGTPKLVKAKPVVQMIVQTYIGAVRVGSGDVYKVARIKGYLDGKPYQFKAVE